MKKTVRRGIAMVLLLLMLLSLAACGKAKDPLPPEEFKSIMEEMGITVVDQTSLHSEKYQTVYLACDEDKYAFEYYILKDTDTASDFYHFVTDKVEKQFKKNSTVVMANSTPYKGDYSLSGDEYYVRVIHTKDAVLYVRAYAANKDECKDILNKMGY